MCVMHPVARVRYPGIHLVVGVRFSGAIVFPGVRVVARVHCSGIVAHFVVLDRDSNTLLLCSR